MEIAIYILLIVMAEMRENIGMKNHHPLHKTNVSIRNEGKGVQGKDFIFSASNSLLQLYNTFEHRYMQQKPISILQELQESLGVGVGIKMKIPCHGKLLGY